MAVVFHDGCSSSTPYTLGSNTTVGGNNGMLGTLGASGSIHISFSGGAYVFEGVQCNIGATATIFQFYIRPSSTIVVGNGCSIFTAMTSSAYNTGTAPGRLDITPSGSDFLLEFVDPSNGYATVTGTTPIVPGTAYKIVIYQTSAGWSIYINNGTTAEISYSHTQTTVGLQYLSLGTLYENGSGATSGVFDIDDIYCANLNAAPSTIAQQIADVYQGRLQNHLSAEGQPYRGPVDGDNLSYADSIDTVSETAAYMLGECVQNNDQASFNLCDGWIMNNLLRANSTVANTQNNAAPTSAYNLMAFHYNSANTDGKGIGTIYDANDAEDADPERAQALLWAHSRWGETNLLSNSSFELNTTGWNNYSGGTIAQSSTKAYQGHYSCGVTITSGGTRGIQSALITGLTPGAAYTFSAWIWAASGVVISSEMDSYNSGTYVNAGGYSSITGSGAWQRLTATFTITGANALQLLLYDNASTTFYVDGMQLEQASSATTYSPQYLERAMNVISDMRTYRFTNSATTGYNYQWNDSFQTASTINMGGDYANPGAFKLFGQYDTSYTSFWTAAANGAYDSWTKAAGVVFSGASPVQTSTVNLNPNWFAFNTTNATVSTTPSTYDSSPQGQYGYNAFRGSTRLQEDYTWYGGTSATNVLKLYGPEFQSLYNSLGYIPVTIGHDGASGSQATYELNYFTWSAYWALNAYGSSDAATIQTAKLSSRYIQASFGSFFNEIPASGSGQQYAYFGSFWQLRNAMNYNSMWINYGQTASSLALASIMTSTSSMAAVLSAKRPLAAISSSTSSMTIALQVTHALGAIATSTSTMTSALGATRSLAAISTSNSSMTVALNASLALAMSSSSGSSMIATLGGSTGLMASMTSPSVMTAVLNATKPLAANSTSPSSMIAGLGGSDSLVASSVSTSTMTAALNVIRALTASSSSISGMSASLNNSETLTANSVSTSTVIVILQASRALVMSATSNSSMTANLSRSVPLSVSGSSVSSMTASLEAKQALAVSMLSTSFMIVSIINYLPPVWNYAVATLAGDDTIEIVDDTLQTSNVAGENNTENINDVLDDVTIQG
jgi:hypothetical protein